MKKLTQEQFIERSKILHRDKYDYSLVNYNNTRTKVKIICKKCNNIFEQTPSSHLFSVNGCPKCAGFNKTHEDFINLVNKIHGQYIYIDKYLYSTKKIKIFCTKEGHGIFEQTPHQHLLGKGCPKCAGFNKTHEDFIKESNKIHGQYEYNDKYVNAHKKIIITCPIHGDFLQKPNDHLQGAGCPICNSSKGEIKIFNVLKYNNIIFQTQKRFKNCINKIALPFDFYLPDYNICIEYDGIQHFQSIDFFGGNNNLNIRKDIDIIKNEYCRNNNIHLIRISYTDFNNIEIILKKELKLK